MDKRRIVTVVFTPQVPDPANQPDIEAVFEVVPVQTFFEKVDPTLLIPLSCTQIDTREPYRMSRIQRNAILEAAAEALAKAED